MKKITIIIILMLGVWNISAQNQRDPVKEYEDFRQKAKKEYSDFRDKANAEYVLFMRQA